MKTLNGTDEQHRSHDKPATQLHCLLPSRLRRLRRPVIQPSGIDRVHTGVTVTLIDALKTELGRTRQLRHGNESIGGTEFNGRIVCAPIRSRSEAV